MAHGPLVVKKGLFVLIFRVLNFHCIFRNKNQTPKDIRMRINQARMHLICGDVVELDDEMEWLAVKDVSSKEKR